MIDDGLIGLNSNAYLSENLLLMSRCALKNPCLCLILVLALAPSAWAGPYPPAAGLPGSDALKNTDPRFVEWASGYQNYIQGSPINKAFTDPTQTLGPAKGTIGGITELGDGGQITLTFDSPIVASPTGGPDFAVFGNSFSSGYLKLAYVEVSQDDIHWYLMPNHSLTPGPVGTYGNNMDASNISGLAGKYVVGYGTPFRLSDVGLQWASYVRLIDVVGDGTNLDSSGNPIYDPSPNSNGFNAGGVGVLSDAATVPEPTSLSLMVLGTLLAGIAWSRRRSIGKHSSLHRAGSPN